MYLSVVIPVYNRDQVIIRALSSVINQNNVALDYDVWIIDDGSTDQTAQFVKDYIVKNNLEHRVFYHYQDNSGVSSARNKAINLSRGEWIAFLDSDDEWLPNKLNEQIAHIKENPSCCLVHSDEVWIRNGVRVNQMKKHRKAGGDIFLRSLKLCLISPSATIVSRKLLETVGAFNPSMTVCEDYDLWLRICYNKLICYIDKPLINKYGGAEDQLSRKYVAMDYWRVLSLNSLIQSERLSLEQVSATQDVLVKKCEILLAGYIKHSNLDKFEEISNIYIQYSGKKFLKES